MQRLALRGQIVLRPRLLVVNQGALARAEGVVLQGGKGGYSYFPFFKSAFTPDNRQTPNDYPMDR